AVDSPSIERQTGSYHPGQHGLRSKSLEATTSCKDGNPNASEFKQVADVPPPGLRVQRTGRLRASGQANSVGPKISVPDFQNRSAKSLSPYGLRTASLQPGCTWDVSDHPSGVLPLRIFVKKPHHVDVPTSRTIRIPQRLSAPFPKRCPTSQSPTPQAACNPREVQRHPRQPYRHRPRPLLRGSWERKDQEQGKIRGVKQTAKVDEGAIIKASEAVVQVQCECQGSEGTAFREPLCPYLLDQVIRSRSNARTETAVAGGPVRVWEDALAGLHQFLLQAPRQDPLKPFAIPQMPNICIWLTLALSLFPGGWVSAEPTPCSFAATSGVTIPTQWYYNDSDSVPKCYGGDTPSGNIVFGTSGPLAATSQLYWGLKAAFEQANTAGGVCGRNLSIVALEDGRLYGCNSYNPPSQLANIETMVAFGVFGLAGTIGTSEALVVSEYLSPLGIPLIETSSGAGKLVVIGIWEEVNMRISFADEALYLVDFALSNLFESKISVFWQEDALGESVLNGTIASLTALGLNLWSNGSYSPLMSTDISSAIEGLIANGPPSVIITAAPFGPLTLLLQELWKDTRFSRNTIFLAVNAVRFCKFVDPAPPRLGGEYRAPTAIVGSSFTIYTTAPGGPPLPNINDSFVQAYSNAWDAVTPIPKSQSGLLAYAAGLLIQSTFERMGCTETITRDRFIDTIYETQMYDFNGTRAGPYIAADSKCDAITCACNQGFHTVSMLNVSSTGVYSTVPDASWSWTTCAASSSSISRPIFLAHMSAPSAQDPKLALKSKLVLLGIQTLLYLLTETKQAIHLVALDYAGNTTTMISQVRIGRGKAKPGESGWKLLANLEADPLVLLILCPVMADSDMWGAFQAHLPSNMPVIAPITPLQQFRTPFDIRFASIRPSAYEEIIGIVNWMVRVHNVSRISILLQADSTGALIGESADYLEIINNATAHQNLITYSSGVFVQGSGDVSAALNSIFVSSYVATSEPNNPITVDGPDGIILGISDAGITEATMFVANASLAGHRVVYGIPTSAAWQPESWSAAVAAANESVFGLADVLFSTINSMKTYYGTTETLIETLSGANWATLMQVSASQGISLMLEAIFSTLFVVSLLSIVATDTKAGLSDSVYINSMVRLESSLTTMSNISYGPFVEPPSSCSRNDSECMKGASNEGAQGFFINVLSNPSNMNPLQQSGQGYYSQIDSTASLNSYGGTMSGSVWMGPAKCDVIEYTTRNLFSNIKGAIKVSRAGATFTGVALVLLCLSLAVAIFHSRSRFSKERAKASQPSLKPKFLVNASLSNFIEIAFIFIEAIQLAVFIFSTLPEWLGENYTKIISYIALEFPIAWYFWFLGGLVIVWNAYAIVILSGAAKRLQHIPYGGLLLLPAATFLPLVSTIGYVPVLVVLLSPLSCRYSLSDAVMTDWCEMACWTTVDSQHWIMAASGFCLVMIFAPLNIETAHIWQELHSSKEAKWDNSFYVIDYSSKVCRRTRGGSRKTFTFTWVGRGASNTTQFLPSCSQPSNVPWMPFIRAIGAFIGAWTAMTGLIFLEATSQSVKNSVTAVCFVGWIVILLLGYAISNRVHPNKFIHERKSETALTRLLKLFNTLRHAKLISSRSSMFSDKSKGRESQRSIFAEKVQSSIFHPSPEGPLEVEALRAGPSEEADLVQAECSGDEDILLELFQSPFGDVMLRMMKNELAHVRPSALSLGRARASVTKLNSGLTVPDGSSMVHNASKHSAAGTRVGRSVLFAEEPAVEIVEKCAAVENVSAGAAATENNSADGIA
ncbi:hypothetical protein BDK51DRAFT_28379, partial [Blyttiomyces helicus]